MNGYLIENPNRDGAEARLNTLVSDIFGIDESDLQYIPVPFREPLDG